MQFANSWGSVRTVWLLCCVVMTACSEIPLVNRISSTGESKTSAPSRPVEAVLPEAGSLASFESHFGVKFDAQKIYAEESAYKGVYVLRNRLDEFMLPVYFDADFKVVVNYPKPVGATTSDPYFVTEKGVKERRSKLAKDIPLEKFIPMKNKTGYLAVVLSAPDCPYSRKMEADLNAAGISYYVAPGALKPESFPYVSGLYCSKDRVGAWRSAMKGKPVTGSAGCAGYPKKDVLDFGFMFMPAGGNNHPVYPQIVFPDGTTYSGWSAESLKAVKARLAQAQFFHGL